jgi:hypothetical protein
MPDWSIKIVPSGTGGGAAFVPDPLNAWQDDLVSWNNTTGVTHQIELVEIAWAAGASAPSFATDPIPKQGSSRPSYDVAQPSPSAWIVRYRCKLHPQEQGTIKVTVYPTS